MGNRHNRITSSSVANYGARHRVEPHPLPQDRLIPRFAPASLGLPQLEQVGDLKMFWLAPWQIDVPSGSGDRGYTDMGYSLTLSPDWVHPSVPEASIQDSCLPTSGVQHRVVATSGQRQT